MSICFPEEIGAHRPLMVHHNSRLASSVISLMCSFKRTHFHRISCLYLPSGTLAGKAMSFFTCRWKIIFLAILLASVPGRKSGSLHNMAPLLPPIYFNATCPEEPILISHCISNGPMHIVIYIFLGLAILGFLGLSVLHILRKLGLTQRFHE